MEARGTPAFGLLLFLSSASGGQDASTCPPHTLPRPRENSSPVTFPLDRNHLTLSLPRQAQSRSRASVAGPPAV